MYLQQWMVWDAWPWILRYLEWNRWGRWQSCEEWGQRLYNYRIPCSLPVKGPDPRCACNTLAKANNEDSVEIFTLKSPCCTSFRNGIRRTCSCLPVFSITAIPKAPQTALSFSSYTCVSIIAPTMCRIPTLNGTMGCLQALSQTTHAGMQHSPKTRGTIIFAFFHWESRPPAIVRGTRIMARKAIIKIMPITSNCQNNSIARRRTPKVRKELAIWSTVPSFLALWYTI